MNVRSLDDFVSRFVSFIRGSFEKNNNTLRKHFFSFLNQANVVKKRRENCCLGSFNTTISGTLNHRDISNEYPRSNSGTSGMNSANVYYQPFIWSPKTPNVFFSPDPALLASYGALRALF